MFARLRDPENPLKGKWKKSEINKFKKQFNSRDPVFNPKASSLRVMPYITLSGEKCCLCKSDQVNNREKLAIMRFMIEERFAASEGKKIGVVVGLVFSDGATRWYDVLLVKGSPIRLLSLPIQPIEYRPMEVTRFGEYYPPLSFSVSVKSPMCNKTLCLLETAAALGMVEPSLIIFPKKTGMETIYMDGAHEWHIETLGSYDMYSYRDCMREYEIKKKKTPTTDPSKKRERDTHQLSEDNPTLSNFKRHMKSFRIEAESNAFNSASGSSLLVPDDSRVRFEPSDGLDNDFDEHSLHDCKKQREVRAIQSRF